MFNKIRRLLQTPPPSFKDTSIQRRVELIRRKEIDLILDVGANTGQFAESILKVWPCNIISFEPMKREFDIISQKSKKNKYWTAYNYGLGDKNEFVDINISKNSYSSSILALNADTIEFEPDIAYVGKEKIQINRLDSTWDSLNITNENILLKIDTQGYEYNILKGCKNIMHHIAGLQIELSLYQLYETEILFESLYTYIKSLGFDLYIIEPEFTDPHSGKLLQVETIFFRSRQHA